jgi:redox-sensitive bicupin YhaK (pirin superfamily)
VKCAHWPRSLISFYSDHFGPKVNDEACEDPDTFPVNWHPHRGFDICSYMLSGSGRHADSLGNRRNFAAPGVSWMSTGSGIEHAEAGGGKGEVQEGFQIWVNVPSAKKMDEPRLGDQSALLEYAHDGWRARLVAGTNGDERASSTPAYVTVQPVQIVDVMVDAGKSGAQRVFADANTAIVYVHNGAGTVCGREVAQRDVLLLDSTDRSARDVTFTAGDGGLKLLVFAGVRLNQPVAWRGPIVMTTKQELMTGNAYLCSRV